MTSGRVSAVTGLFETKDATISEVIRINSSFGGAELLDVSAMTSAPTALRAGHECAIAGGMQSTTKVLTAD
jgi:hypothetical protein